MFLIPNILTKSKGEKKQLLIQDLSWKDPDTGFSILERTPDRNLRNIKQGRNLELAPVLQAILSQSHDAFFNMSCIPITQSPLSSCLILPTVNKENKEALL